MASWWERIGSSATSDELERLKNKLEVVRLLAGGSSVEKTRRPKQMTDYDFLKTKIESKLKYLLDISKMLDSGKYTKINEIKYRNIKRNVMKEVTEDIKIFKQIYESQKNTSDHVRIDGEMTVKEMCNLMEKISGISMKKPSDKVQSIRSFIGQDIESDDNDIGSGTGLIPIPIRTKQEPLTAEHQEQLSHIAVSINEQDQVLQEIDQGLDNLLEIANKMNDELELQKIMIHDIDAKTDKKQTKLDNTNKRMLDIKKITNGRPICCYILCFVLLGVCGYVGFRILYN
jgi:hypothetical protein